MAEKLGKIKTNDAELTKLVAKKAKQAPARAAKGAGKSKPKPAPARLQPDIPKGRGSVKVAPAKSPEDEAKLREALALRLIGLRKQHHDVDVKIEALRDEITELNADRKIVRDAVVRTGMPLDLFDQGMKDAKTSRVDLQRREELRATIREAFGIPCGPQGKLELSAPTPAQAAIYWESEGYRICISGGDPIPPKECHPKNHQDFMKGFHSGQARIAAGMKALDAEKETKRTPLAAAVEKSKANGGAHEGMLKNGAGVLTEEAQARAAALTNEEMLEEAAKHQLDLSLGRPEMERAVLIAQGHDMDGWEATPEELAKQGARRALQEKRAADEASAKATQPSPEVMH